MIELRKTTSTNAEE